MLINFMLIKKRVYFHPDILIEAILIKKSVYPNFFTFDATFLKVEQVYGISIRTKRFPELIVILATLEKSWL